MTTSATRITIITPVLNQVSYIEESILSVLNQNYANLEYIIVDGGSTDGTIDIINKYRDRIDAVISEPDAGQSDAINKGLRISSGELINWLNADDKLGPGALSRLNDEFVDDSTCGLYYGSCLFFDESTHGLRLNKVAQADLPAKQLGLFPYSQPSTFFSRRALETVGLLNTSLHYCMDVDLFLRIDLEFDSKEVDRQLSIFRIHPNSKSGSQAEKFFAEWRAIYSAVNDSYKCCENIEVLRDLGLYREAPLEYNATKRYTDNDVLKSLSYFLAKQLVHECPSLVWNGRRRRRYLSAMQARNPTIRTLNRTTNMLCRAFLPAALLVTYAPNLFEALKMISRRLPREKTDRNELLSFESSQRERSNGM